MSEKINKRILLTNAGTVIAQNAIEYNLKKIAGIYGVDASDFCYAAKILKNNFFKVPLVKHWARYRRALLAICRKNRIDLIIPCGSDEELIKLAASRDEFAKIKTDILLSGLKPVLLCDDKIKLSRLAASLGIKIPEIYAFKSKARKIHYPVVIKNLRGGGSENVLIAKDENELNKKFDGQGRMIQRLVSGSEFSVDLVLDNNSEMIVGLCRKRIQVKAGICVKTEICDQHYLLASAAKIAKHLKLIGPVNVQFVEDYLIEVNPRLPGGLGLDCAAGINLALLGIKAYYNLPITKKEKTVKHHKISRIWQEIIYD